MRVGGQVAQRKDIISQRRIYRELAVGVPEGILLGGDEPLVKQGVEIEHLVRRLVDDLLREQIFDRGREVVDLETLTPAAVDIVKHPLEGPQPADQAVLRMVVQAILANGLDHVLYRGSAALVPASLDQLACQALSR